MRPHRVASTLLALAALAPLPARADYSFVAATDFGSGCASWLEGFFPWTAHGCVEDLSSDPVCRWAFGRVYVVNRFGFDNVQVLDPGNGFATIQQFSVGNGSNPQDIAVLSPTKAYVSRLASPDLWIVNPATGAFVGAISLAAFNDGDGSPEPFKMFVYGDRVFLALQRLDNFVPTDSSYVVAIDTRTDALLDADPIAPGVQGILLTGTNPNTDFAFDGAANRLLIGETGSFGVADGGIEGLDPIALAALGFETTEPQLGGDVNDIALAPNGRAYAVVSDDLFDTHLVRYDRTNGDLVGTLFSPGGFSLGDIEVNSAGELWLCDRTFASPGIRIFDTASDGPLAGPIDVGLPPFDVAFDEYEAVAVDAKSGPGGLRLVSAGPNPCRTTFEVRFAADDGRNLPARLTIFDARGARVGATETVASASGRLVWQAAAPPGVYFYHLERGPAALAGRFVLLK